MTSPVNSIRKQDSYEVEQKTSFFCCYIRKKVRKVNPAEPTKAFKKEFKPKDGDLVRTKPIRYNPETQKMEVGHNGGAGVVWKPISDEE